MSILNEGTTRDERVEILSASPYGEMLSSLMPKHGLSVIDIIFSPHATKKQPKIHEAMLIFSDRYGSIWKMRPALLSPELKSDNPVFGGVYIIHGEGCTLYVGKSINLRRRIKDHLQDAKRFVKDGISYVVTDVTVVPADDSVMHILEMQLISKLRPVFNIDSVPLNPIKVQIDVPDGIPLDGWEDYYKAEVTGSSKAGDMSMEAFAAMLKRNQSLA
jgi:hypothetical protein